MTGVFASAFGAWDYSRRVVLIGGDVVQVPEEVVSRGFRLAHKHKLYASAYDYVIKWAAHKIGLI